MRCLIWFLKTPNDFVETSDATTNSSWMNTWIRFVTLNDGSSSFPSLIRAIGAQPAHRLIWPRRKERPAIINNTSA